MRFRLENVTNLLGAVTNVLTSTSTNFAMEESSKSKKKSAIANPSEKTRGEKTKRKPCRLDANGKENSTRERK